MPLLGWIIIFSLLGGVLSVLAASVFLLIKDNHQKKLLPHFISYAIGALLGAAFLALLPHAIEVSAHVDLHDIGLTILIGLLCFFLLEKMVLWRHCHSNHCEVHTPLEVNTNQHSHHHHAHGNDNEKDASGSLIIIGDAVHNFVDGVLIAAAFMTDVDLGIVTALAVATHEIPQEIGDFAILLNSGYTRARALFFNVLASLTTVVGAVIAFYSLQSMQGALPYILAIAASSFIYIAVADLIPGLHKKTELRETLQQITLIIFGVITIYWAHSTLH